MTRNPWTRHRFEVYALLGLYLALIAREAIRK